MNDQLQDPKLKEFLSFCREKIGYKSKTKVRLFDDHNVSKEMKSMAAFFPKTDEIWVLRGKRVRADWYRSLAHELVHLRQREENGTEMDGGDGSEIENEANALAAVILREYGRLDPTIYEPADGLITEGHYPDLDVATVAQAIDRGMLEFDPKNFDTFPTYLKVLNWIKDSSDIVFKEIQDLEFKKALYFAKEVQSLADDMVAALERALESSKDNTEGEE